VHEVDQEAKTAKLSAPGIIDRLEASLRPFEDLFPQRASLATPMLEGVLKVIQRKAAEDELMPGEFVNHARSLLGIGGWVAVQVRPDVFFGFVVLAQQIVVNLTPECWTAVLQWARPWSSTGTTS